MSSDNATGAQELPYKIVKDKHGTEHKVIDLDNETTCPRIGSVMFESCLRKNRKKGTRIPFKMCKDKFSGVLIGICTGIHARTGDLDWLPIYVGDGTVFNLAIRDEAQKAAVLMRSTIVEGSTNVSEYHKLTLFRIHDELVAARNTIQRVNDAERAISLAKGIYGENLKDIARNLGIGEQHTNEIILQAAVLDRAIKNPTEFLKVYENPNLEYLTIYNKAFSMGVITHDPISGYFFRGIPLGINENYIIEYFKEHPEVPGSIKAICKEKEKESKVSNTIRPSADPEKEALKNQIAELEARLKNVPKETDHQTDLESELELWKERARKIGGPIAQGLPFFKPNRESIDRLKAKVEAETQNA